MNFKMGATVALASAVMAASATASASEMSEGWFIGGTVGMAKRSLESKDNFGRDVHVQGLNGGAEELDGSMVYGIRAGKFINDNVRVYTDITIDKGDTESYNGIDSGFDDMQLSVSADYVDSIFGSQSFKYFVGGTVGVNKMEFTMNDGHRDGSGRFDGKESDRGFVYGAQVGVIYDIMDNLSAEIGYQYLVLNNKARYTEQLLGGTHSFDVESKDKQSLMMNVSYKF